MGPENRWLEDVFPTEMVAFWGHVSFRGCLCFICSTLYGSWVPFVDCLPQFSRSSGPSSGPTNQCRVQLQTTKKHMLHTLLVCILCMLCILCIVFRLCILPSINHQHVYPRSIATNAQVSLSCISTKSHRNVYEIYPPGKKYTISHQWKQETNLPNYPCKLDGICWFLEG